mmetsp:Transcript_53377/g.87308  ORF Transcript_53377/g.87308 Transcript_53377/m.87308 type:complete len:83 (+) Transcript_53377:1173-1421(+)
MAETEGSQSPEDLSVAKNVLFMPIASYFEVSSSLYCSIIFGSLGQLIRPHARALTTRPLVGMAFPNSIWGYIRATSPVMFLV